MAYYAALVSLIELLKEISHHGQRYPNSILDKQQIHASLYEKFKFIQELLEYYSPKDFTEESADILERRIRDAAYQTQDIIESYTSNQIPTEDSKILVKDKPRGGKGIFRHLISAFREAPQCLQLKIFKGPPEKNYYQDLEEVEAEVDSIVQELMMIKERHRAHAKDLQLNSYVSTESYGGTSKVQAPSGRNALVGVEEYLTTIKAQLCGESSKLVVISIVGMGGLGKSTLARNVFDDKLIHDHFDCRIWVTVSQDYYRRNILLAIVDSLNIRLSEMNEEVLVENIYKHLKGRRYLIVMDDMWETRVWDDVKRIFPDDDNGSRVITTTRLLNVAIYADNSRFIHQLQLLDEEQSWNLFCQKVLCPPRLVDIGMLIAKRCRGLPLAIVVVAGLLSKVNPIQHDWEEIAGNVSSAAAGNDEDFPKLVSLSYKHLPHHLKPCFLYLGGFPEDYEISVSKLIKLWVAEGFLKPIPSKSLEEAGKEYLKDLVDRNLVLATKRKSGGKFSHCSIHDLLRDLCSQRACYENFLHYLPKKDGFHESFLHYQPNKDDFRGKNIEKVHRLYIQKSDDHHLFLKDTEKQTSHIRAIPFFDNAYIWRQFLSVASDFKLLRILDGTRRYSYHSPDLILELLNLRYLALPKFVIRIPPSVFKLQHLQTLIVHGGVLSLPSEIWKMPHLRHVVSWAVTFPPIPYGEIRISDEIPLLGKLQTLCIVENFIFTSNTVKMIPNLRKLKVRWRAKLSNDYNWEELELANLVHLPQLRRLGIQFAGWAEDVIPLPKNFVFPSNLMKLRLCGTKLPWKDMRVVGLLPNLQMLKLIEDAFVGEEWEPIEGEFLKLKFLMMKSLRSLKYWRAENIHFPCLEQLHIKHCTELEEIPLEIGDIPTLQLIDIDGSVLDSSALRIQEEQRDQGNDDLQVRINQIRLKRDPDLDSYSGSDLEYSDSDSDRLMMQ